METGFRLKVSLGHNQGPVNKGKRDKPSQKPNTGFEMSVSLESQTFRGQNRSSGVSGLSSPESRLWGRAKEKGRHLSLF